jgi:NADH-quinone oxidoreductase subunit G
MQMIKIEINGVIVEAEAGSMIIQVADRMEVPIPRFCYHRKLSVAANCRMCLVHVEKAPKALPACATPIADGMKIWTASKTAVDAQKAVMEFLLINHPLDCPICDQGGECELQDVSMDYGRDISRYTEAKRVVLDQNLGSLISTDMTRCIQCTRCVRFGTEISGERELGATGRTEHMEIGTFVEKHMNSEVSGNIIDLCPVGALTSKPFRFSARAWELDQYPSISPHDCLGSNLYLHVRNNIVMRVVPKDKEDINENWLSDRDRFSYQALLHNDRLRKPMLRKQDKWMVASWVEALKYAVAGIKLVIDKYGADQLGTLATPNATLEEYYLLQQFTRSLGSNNIDHRLRQLDFTSQEHAPIFPNLGIKVNALDKQDVILLIGSHIHKEQPIAGLKIRKAVINGAKVCAVNPVDFAFNFVVAEKIIPAAGDLVTPLAGVAKAILELKKYTAMPELNELLANTKPTAAEQKIAATLVTGSKRHIILGQLALMHPQATQLALLANCIASMIDGTTGAFSDGANAAGAWLAGCVPHRLPGGQASVTTGKNAVQMLQQPLKCYILYALEPEFDSILGAQALQTLQEADFVIVLSSYQSDTLLEIADVLLPIAAFTENSGTMINVDGTWQSNSSVVHAFGDSRPGWKVIRVLGNIAGLDNFEYASVEQITATIKQQIGSNHPLTSWKNTCPGVLNNPVSKSIVRIAPIALYATDSLVRRAEALQATKDAINNPAVHMNLQTSKELHVADGSLVNIKSVYGNAKLTVKIDPTIADQSVLVYQANVNTNSLGAAYSVVEVSL